MSRRVKRGIDWPSNTASGTFAGGFAICGIAYLALVYLVFKRENDGMERIATTWALRHLYGSIYVEVPNPAPPGPFGMAFATLQLPDHNHFMHIGQQFWALLIGWLGGLLACYVRRRPAADFRGQPPPGST